jgi:hypothetical protein
MSRGWLLHWVLLACAAWGTAAAEVGTTKHTRDWRHLAQCVVSARKRRCHHTRLAVSRNSTTDLALLVTLRPRFSRFPQICPSD